MCHWFTHEGGHAKAQFELGYYAYSNGLGIETIVKFGINAGRIAPSTFAGHSNFLEGATWHARDVSARLWQKLDPTFEF